MNKMNQEFNSLREEKNYAALGRFFWNGFLFEKAPERRILSRLWDSLTKNEQKMCED